MTVTETLNEINKYLVQSEAYVLDFLLPGISKDEINTQLENIKIKLPDDVYQLYQWRNGIANIYDHNFNHETFFNFGIFYSLQSAIELYKTDSLANKYWDEIFFPLFTNGGGDFLLVNVDEQSKEYGFVYLYSPMINLSTDPISIYDSVSTMLDTILLSYQKRAYFYVDRELEDNSKLESEIAKSLNPQSLFWHLDDDDDI